MPNVRTLWRSFNGGEVTPEFYGQLADSKFQTGLALARNCEILPHGPAQNRAGFQFVRAVKDSTKRVRVVPYSYSTTQTFAIELGAGYFRFHTQGATLLVSGVAAYNPATPYVQGNIVSSGGINYYAIQASTGIPVGNTAFWYPMPAGNIFEVPNPFAEADLFDIHYVQSQDVLTLVHPNYAPMQLQRRGATYWTLITETFASDLAQPVMSSAVSTATGTGMSPQLYKVTAVGETGVEEGLASLNTGLAARAVTAITIANPGVFTTSVAHGFAVGETVTIAGVSASMTQLGNDNYRVASVPSTTTFTLQRSDGSVVNTTGYTAYSGAGGTAAEQPYIAINNLLTTGNYNNIFWDAVTGATRYNVYKQSNGLYGYIGQTDQLTFKDDNITADISKTPPVASQPFIGAGNFPGAVSYFEQRKAYAGTINKPQNLWMTQSGTEANLGYSIPTRDDDAIAFRVAAREANTIRHIVPLNNLILLTSSAEWRVTAVNSDALTPTSISVRPQSYIGSSNVQPVIVNNNLIYAAARGGHARELGYSWQQQSYSSGDLSLRAPHLFDGRTIVDMAYAKSPQPIVFMPSSNGDMLGITYVPEQQVGAWCHADTYTKVSKSLIESVCVVAEGNEDVLYAVIQRVINGAVVRYIERKHSRLFTESEDQFFVDAGASYDIPITITGITSANPVVVTAPSHGFSNGDPIDITQVIGMATTVLGTNGLPTGVFNSLINGNRYYASAVTANTFALQDENGVNINGSTWPAYLRGGVARKAISTIVSGLAHLEGEIVNVLADGAVSPPQVVTGGALPSALEAPASRIQIGLPITCDIQTLPVALEIAGFGQGRQKNVNKIWLRVKESSGIFAGPSFDKLKEAKQRTTEPYGSPPALQSREISLTLTPEWQDSGFVCVRQSDPLALTLVSMSMDVSIGA